MFDSFIQGKELCDQWHSLAPLKGALLLLLMPVRGGAPLKHPARIQLCLLLHTITIITQLLVLSSRQLCGPAPGLHLAGYRSLARLLLNLLFLLKHHLQDVRVSVAHDGSGALNAQVLVAQFHLHILRFHVRIVINLGDNQRETNLLTRFDHSTNTGISCTEAHHCLVSFLFLAF